MPVLISVLMSPQDCSKRRRPQAWNWPAKVPENWRLTASSQQSSFHMWEKKPSSQLNCLTISWRSQSLWEANGRPQGYGYQDQHLWEVREGAYFGKKFKLSRWDGLVSKSACCLCHGWQPELDPQGERPDCSKLSFDLHTWRARTHTHVRTWRYKINKYRWLKPF